MTARDLERLLTELRASAPKSCDGLFGPDSMTWQISRESGLFLAAGRAALLQLAHPWVAAAIAEHSTTLQHPVRRFHNTFRVMFTMAFGSLEQALAAARRLHRLHSGIRGTIREHTGSFAQGTSYEANEVNALSWVYATLVDSSVQAYELVLPPLTASERERYYAESRTTATLFGIPPGCLPQTWSEFSEYVESMYCSETLGVGPCGRNLAHQLQAGAGLWVRPSFWYRALTVHLLPPRFREEFHLPYGDREQRSAERVLHWLPRIYCRLPETLRFVGPYHEAQAKLRGESRLGLMVRLSNRLWVGKQRLFA